MNIDDKDKFLDVMKGVPSSFLTQALNTYGTGSNWTGCSKKLIHEFLFGNTHKQALSKTPSLCELRDHAIRIQESSRKAVEVLKNIKKEQEKRRKEDSLLKTSMKKQQRESVLYWIGKGYKIDGIQVRLTNGNDIIFVSDETDLKK
jgi:hypothetical protein